MAYWNLSSNLLSPIYFASCVTTWKSCLITLLLPPFSQTVFLFSKSLLYCLMQEPCSFVVPGLRYEGKYNNWHHTAITPWAAAASDATSSSTTLLLTKNSFEKDFRWKYTCNFSKRAIIANRAAGQTESATAMPATQVAEGWYAQNWFASCQTCQTCYWGPEVANCQMSCMHTWDLFSFTAILLFIQVIIRDVDHILV